MARTPGRGIHTGADIRTKGRGKFSRYFQAEGFEVFQFFNETIRRTLRDGLRTATESTKFYTGRAAYHWTLLAQGKGFAPGSLKYSQYHDNIRGMSPVGTGQISAGQQREIVNAVMARNEEIIRRGISGNTDTPVFALWNAVPASPDQREDGESEAGNSYRTNALIEEALQDAYDVMEQRFHSAVQRGNIRQRARVAR